MTTQYTPLLVKGDEFFFLFEDLPEVKEPTEYVNKLIEFFNLIALIGDHYLFETAERRVRGIVRTKQTYSPAEIALLFSKLDIKPKIFPKALTANEDGLPK